DGIPSRASGLQRTAFIISGRLRRGDECGNFADTIRKSRQFAEKFWQLRINLLADVAIACHEIFRLCVEELRIGPEKFNEVLEASFKSDLFDERIHFAMNPGNLAQSELMDLLWSQIGRGVLAR